MIRPITYTYKGRPLAPYGSQKSARTLKRRKAIRSAIRTGLCVLAVLAVFAALGWWLSSCFRSGEAPTEENTAVPTDASDLTEETQSEVRPEAEVPKKTPPATAVTTPRTETPPARLSESADRQALRIYSSAASAFQKKDYENVLVVCHGGIIRPIRGYFENVKRGYIWRPRPKNCEIFVYESKNGTHRLVQDII